MCTRTPTANDSRGRHSFPEWSRPLSRSRRRSEQTRITSGTAVTASRIGPPVGSGSGSESSGEVKGEQRGLGPPEGWTILSSLHRLNRLHGNALERVHEGALWPPSGSLGLALSRSSALLDGRAQSPMRARRRTRYSVNDAASMPQRETASIRSASVSKRNPPEYRTGPIIGVTEVTSVRGTSSKRMRGP